MQLNPDNFHLESVGGNDGYIDFEMSDKSANSVRRLWTLTYCTFDDSWAAHLRRAETDDGSFEFGTPELPAKIIKALRIAALSQVKEG